MKKRNNKKGFTIVELVIVIAVIAILAAVLIPTFSNIVKKANLSNDQQNVRNMNTALAVEVIPNSKFATAGDAINALYGEGWNLGKLETYSKDYDYAYSLENNRMYLLDETGTVVYPEESIDKSTLWGLYKDERTSAVQGIKKYVALNNITNSDHYNSIFIDNNFLIDLNGFFIAVDAVNVGVKVNNGILISGASAGEEIDTDYSLADTITDYEFASSDYSESGNIITIEKKIFNETKVLIYYNNKDVIFNDCIFYNSPFQRADETGIDAGKKTIFKNCKFIGGNETGSNGWAITAFDSLELDGCEFINLRTRGAINYYDSENSISTFIVNNCVFGSTQGEYPIIRFVSNGVSSSGPKLGQGFSSVQITNNTFGNLGKGTGILGFNSESSRTHFYEVNADFASVFTFENNTVDKSINTTMYFLLDKPDGTLASKFGESIK